LAFTTSKVGDAPQSAREQDLPAEVKKLRRNYPKSATDLFVSLVKLGYRYCRPASRTWSSGFILKRDASVLCVLFRKNGIDLRLYESYKGEISIDSRNVAYISGGELFRNHYNESDNFIHLKVATIASCFAAGTLREELRTQDGRSYRLNPKYEGIRKRAKEAFQRRDQDLRDAANDRAIWEYISEDCGGYMGDGEWL